MPDPLFVPNKLKPVPLDEKSLKNALKILQEAIAKSAMLLADLSERISGDDAAYSSKIAHIYSGDSGAFVLLSEATDYRRNSLSQEVLP